MKKNYNMGLGIVHIPINFETDPDHCTSPCPVRGYTHRNHTFVIRFLWIHCIELGQFLVICALVEVCTLNALVEVVMSQPSTGLIFLSFFWINYSVTFQNLEFRTSKVYWSI